MSIAFKARDRDHRPPSVENGGTHLFAAKVFSGIVNVVSGHPFAASNGGLRKEQDHIVIPLQTRLDGFRDAGGRSVKQFVAMPLGSGYSVESQSSSTEIGGLQIQITPRLQTGVVFTQYTTTNSDLDPTRFLMAWKNPRNLGLAIDSTVRMAEVGRTTI
jgi:hypothetical protein